MRMVAIALLLGACAPADGPDVDEVAPARAARGANVMIGGAGFCADSSDTDTGCLPAVSGYVDLGLVPPIVRAEPVGWSGTWIEVTVPASAPVGTTTLYVTVEGRSSNGVSFEVLP